MSVHTAALEGLLDVNYRVRTHGTVTPLREVRPRLVWAALRELRRLPELVCHLDYSAQGRWIRGSLGTRIRLAMELPAGYEAFLARHERANNLKKSMRRAAKAGIVCEVIHDESERSKVLVDVLTRAGDPDPLRNLSSVMGLKPALGTHLVARGPNGRPLSVGIVLISSTTAQLALLRADPSAGSTTVVRYALNAFAVQVAIESGAETMLLTTGYLSAPPGLRVFARNTGYHPRRLRAGRRHAVRSGIETGVVALQLLFSVGRVRLRASETRTRTPD